MNRERLERTAVILDTVDPKNFSLFDWKCGSVCCAVGHAASDPVLQAEGLRLGSCYSPVFETYTDWDAVCRFYDIHSHTAFYLFAYTSYEPLVTPADVAARIRKFIKEGASHVSLHHSPDRLPRA